jgi:hypothetical protein
MVRRSLSTGFYEVNVLVSEYYSFGPRETEKYFALQTVFNENETNNKIIDDLVRINVDSCVYSPRNFLDLFAMLKMRCVSTTTVSYINPEQRPSGRTGLLVCQVRRYENRTQTLELTIQ